ncbi:MAG TPA: hypothetical protein VK625_06395 [Flavitalea sp.]|nr:hypothetical protein [Flavitalea sp.]
MSEELQTISAEKHIDRLEVAMADGYMLSDFALSHEFTPGIYTRTIFMEAGSLIVSEIHNTTHQFVILEGRVSVFTERDGIVELAAPHKGITPAGTRRVLYIHEDCLWMTVHRTDVAPVSDTEEDIRTAVAQVKDEIISKRKNPLLEEWIDNIFKTIKPENQCPGLQ